MIFDMIVAYLAVTVIELTFSTALLHLIFKYHLRITWKDFFSGIFNT